MIFARAGAACGGALVATTAFTNTQGTRDDLDAISARVTSIESNLGIQSGKPCILYSNRICPFAHRAHIAAVEKNAPFTYEKIPLLQEIKKNPSLSKPEFFLNSVNPAGTVPALLYDGTYPINESDVCAEFLANAYSGGTDLMPKDPVLHAKVRLAMKTVDVVHFYRLIKNQDPTKDAELATNLQKQLAKFEAFIDSAKGPYVLGESPSVAEVLLIPFLDRFRYSLKYYRGYDCIEPGSKMEALMNAFEKRKSFQDSAMDGQFYIDAYAGYVGDRGRSRFSE
jgi:glutathione S-transferase